MDTYSARILTTQDEESQPLTAGGNYTILLPVSGSAIISGYGYTRPLSSEHMLLLQPTAEVRIEFQYQTCEYCVLRFSPSLLRSLSDDNTDLESSFRVVPLPYVAERVESRHLMLIRTLSRRLSTLHEGPPEFGDTIFEEGLLKMLIVQILRAFISVEHHVSPGARHHLLMDEIFSYLHAHIQEELSLDDLATRFYVSKFHLSREFKKQTGETLHSYIVKAKLGVCCNYIEQGYPISEVYKLGGFGGYNNFFRAFKKVYGMTPKSYYRSFRKGAHAMDHLIDETEAPFIEE